jgi:hypothetical protein
MKVGLSVFSILLLEIKLSVFLLNSGESSIGVYYYSKRGTIKLV